MLLTFFSQIFSEYTVFNDQSLTISLVLNNWAQVYKINSEIVECKENKKKKKKKKKGMPRKCQ